MSSEAELEKDFEKALGYDYEEVMKHIARIIARAYMQGIEKGKADAINQERPTVSKTTKRGPRKNRARKPT